MSRHSIEVSHLSRLYSGVPAVNDVSFTLSQGQVLGFLGPNGAGKSTTMKMLTGNLAPHTGNIKICGVDMIENPKHAKALIGYLPEVRPLYKEFTVDEYLTIAARLHNVPSKHINKSVDYAKARCGLTHMSKRLIENLSNGYQQRVGIAQAIIHNPKVVILDEPTVGLDPIQIRDIRKLIKEIGQEHSVIVSTHILPEVEMVCNHVQIIDKGHIVFNGSIDVLKSQRMRNKLLLGLRHAPDPIVLGAVPGVTEIEHIDGMWRISFNESEQPHEAIVATAVKYAWGLYHISPDQSSLEDIFVQLTDQMVEARPLEAAE
jgi:ABC-2 type transport system ATP-binding protein